MTEPLSDFEAGYIECAFWASGMDAEYGFADLAPETLADACDTTVRAS